ncbi:MAG: hypothetical protein HF314_02065 [Ignavibacteria bacterium]|jgi:hypothetical protein|nr:hypothetical protein [Ignavibacteria bacterium]MCU7501830.1 hypothetical protein [Ignavibacteria bacterium]MCU7514824.1 hypothetical protein [Ignavibacteria bacterium]
MAGRLKPVVVVFIVLFSFLQFNCGSTAVYRLSSIDGEPVWDYGWEVVGKKNNAGEAHISFVEAKDGYFVFLLNYENRTEKPVLLDPGEIYYEVFRDSIPRHPGMVQRTYAVDPELELAGIEKKSSSLDASERSRLGLSAIVSTIDVVGSVVSIGTKRSSKELKKQEKEREERMIADENAKISYENDKATLAGEKDYWMNDVLRKVTVFPGEKEGGYFHVSIRRNADFIRLIIPVGGNLYSFDYRQYEVKSLR